MAGALGNLLIQLTADTAQARSDIGKTAHQVERDMAEMQRNATAAGFLIAESIGKIAGAFARAAKDALDFGDTLNKMSQRTNFSVERLSELAFAAELADVSVNQVGSALGMFNKVLADAAKESSRAAGIFSALGVDITQGPQVAFEQFAQAINSLPDGEQKVAAMRAVFGRAGDALLPMMAGLDEATEKARKLGIVMSQEMARDSERFKDSMTLLGASMRSLSMEAMAPLTKWLAELASGMAEARIKGEALSVALLNIGRTWAVLWADFARTFGATAMSEAMEAEFNRLDAQLLKMRQGFATSQATAPGAEVNQGALAKALANDRDKKTAGRVGSTKRDDNLLGRQLQEDMDEWAKIMSEAAAATDKYNQTVRERSVAEVQAEIAAQVARAESIIQMEEILDQQTRMANGWDEQGRKIADSAKKVADFGASMGFSLTSAFEDAIIAGKKFSDVLRSLGQDIARMIIRESVTAPLGKAIGGALGGIFGGIFGGARAEGGPVSGGSAYLVGERGPELFVPGMSGGIVPNHAIAGTSGDTIVNVNFSANTPAAVRDAVYSMLPQLQRATVAAVRDERNRTGDRR